MGATPDQIEREIEQTRADLAATIGEIEERLHPRRLARDHLPLIAGVATFVGLLLAVRVVRRARS